MEYKFLKKSKQKDIISRLDPLIKEWFFSKFDEFSETQLYGVLPIFKKQNILVSAPTGSTKTLTAFLSILNNLVRLAKNNELKDKIYAVYSSPLKALSNDIYFNLEKPLEEINELANSKGIELQKIRVGLRTGDTTQKERQAMLKNSPHILVTTPESLAIMINSPKFSEKLSEVEYSIVDEIHSLAENKRGVHLSLTLERLQEVNTSEITRIGLSATIAPLEKVANFLVGKDRDCKIAEVRLLKKLDLRVKSPVGNFLDADYSEVNKNLYELIDELIQKNKTTLIFTNTRAATERVVHNLKEKFPENYIEKIEESEETPNIGAHHSSLSKKHRKEIEDDLREGKLKVVVCSTSLELGIDIGYIDLVVLLSSPKSVSRAMQRIGRAGHQLHEVARGIFIVSDFDDLVECSVILKNSLEKIIDKVHIPTNCLDVLSQHIYGMSIYKVWDADEMFETIKKSYCFKDLIRDDFFSVISYLSGEYDLRVKNLYAKIWYDPWENKIGKRGKLARVIYMTNIGTIPDESFAKVVLRTGESVGKIDELFLEKLRKGDVFVLGGSTYEFLYTKGMKVYVVRSSRNPTIPSWFSEVLPLSFTTANSIGEFRGLMLEMFKKKKTKKQILDFIKKYLYIDNENAEIIYNYFKIQHKNSFIPTDKEILLEKFRDRGRDYVIFHTLFGRRVNDALSRAMGYIFGSFSRRDVQVGINDNGFYLRADNLDLNDVERLFKKMNSKDLEELLEEAIEQSEVLKRRFRHVATRGLMILRNYKGRVKSVGKQQMSSHFLLAAVKKKTKKFPILKEARREVLEDLMDINNAKLIIDKINKKEITTKTTISRIVSPFAINLILQSYSDIIKIEDKVEFIKRIYSQFKK